MIETYVTVHDQDVILAHETNGRYAELESHTYLFVGPRPVDRVPAGIKIIVARDYEPNYERWPQFYDFTGWYVLAHHGLIEAEHVICIQYDMWVRDVYAEARCQKWLEQGPGPIAFTAGHNHAHNFMLLLPDFAETYRAGVARLGVDPTAWPDFDEWPSTQGTAWRAEDLTEFMLWFEPLFEVFADDTWAGHLAERCVKAWCMNTGKTERYMHGAIAHENLDCHGTCALMGGNRELYERRRATFGQSGFG